MMNKQAMIKHVVNFEKEFKKTFLVSEYEKFEAAHNSHNMCHKQAPNLFNTIRFWLTYIPENLNTNPQQIH